MLKLLIQRKLKNVHYKEKYWKLDQHILCFIENAKKIELKGYPQLV